MRRLNPAALLIASAIVLGRPAEACTIFLASDGKTVMAGNNEDYRDPNTFAWIRPGTEDTHGRIVFGFANGFPQGGMNEQGLFFDGAATSVHPVQSRDDRTDYRMDLLDHMLATCSTAKEAVTFLDSYQIPWLDRAMIFIGDRSGDALIYEGDRTVRRDDEARHLVVTNYYQSETSLKESTCWRHRKAEEIFNKRFGADETLTVDLMRDVLDAVHVEGTVRTLYSNVYDLTNGVVHLYLEHDFSTAVKLDLASELERGARRVTIREFFEAQVEDEG